MDITTLFCDIDDFVKQHSQTQNLIESTKPSKHRLSSSEIMTICIAYHQSGYKNFKAFYGDKGYISKKIFSQLLDKGLHLITGIKKNMKNKLLTLTDKILLRKRSIIETINDQLKNISNIEHSRHSSVHNFIINFLCALIAYTLQDKKPEISGINRELIAMS